jgi:hypothetical protein
MTQRQQTRRLFMRIEPELLAQIEAWRGKQQPIPSRSEAIRQLLTRALLDTELHVTPEMEMQR